VGAHLKRSPSIYVYDYLQPQAVHVDGNGRFTVVFPIPFSYARGRYYMCAGSTVYEGCSNLIPFRVR
jgi:hypothetical protein